jgi:hypothetical protein
MKQLFLELAHKAKKVVLPYFDNNYRYYIFKDNHKGLECYVLYSRKPRSYCDFEGSHWFYYHDAVTGEFIDSFNRGVKVPDNKERLLRADILALNKAYEKSKKQAA